MPGYDDLKPELQQEVQKRLDLLFGLCQKPHPLRDVLMRISRETTATLINIRENRKH